MDGDITAIIIYPYPGKSGLYSLSHACTTLRVGLLGGYDRGSHRIEPTNLRSRCAQGHPAHAVGAHTRGKSRSRTASCGRAEGRAGEVQLVDLTEPVLGVGVAPP